MRFINRLNKTDKIISGSFIIICAILWFCVQTGGHSDFIIHRDDIRHNAHKEKFEELQGQITSQEKLLQEEAILLKGQIEILRIQMAQLSALLKNTKFQE